MAEGVDSREALGELRRLGCDLVQGFVLATPMTAAAFQAWMFANELGLSGERHAPRQAAIDWALPVGTPLPGKTLSGMRAAVVGPLQEVA